MTVRRSRRRAAALLVAVLASCGPARRDAPRTASAAPFSIASVRRQVHLAWRRAAGALEAGERAHVARTTARGELAFAARRDRAESAPLRLGPARLSRGGTVAGADPAPPRVGADGALAIPRGAVLETWRNEEGGVEQAWRFASRPPGRGPLTVRLRASGLAFAGETASGLHFADGAARLGVRYGHASWIDAAGRRTAVRARLAGGDIVLSVPAEVVDDASYPAVLDPLVSPEAAVDEPVVSAAPDAQTQPAIARAGTTFLVAWIDRRSLEQDEIWCARVGADGALLDPVGIPVATGPGQRGAPSVASDGTRFAVAWSDAERVLVAAVDPASAIAAGPVTASDPGASATTVAIAGHAGGYVVVWADGRWPARGLYASALGTDLSPVARGTHVIAVWSGRPSVACRADGCLAAADVYDDYGYRQVRYRAARLGLDAAVLTPAFEPGAGIASAQSQPAVAATAAGWVLAWADGRGGQPSAVYAARVAPDATLVDAQGVLVTSHVAARPAVAWDGTTLLVAWGEGATGTGQDVWAARLDPSLAALDPAPLPVAVAPGEQARVSLAAAPGLFAAAWDDARDGGAPDVYAARVPATGDPLDSAGLRISSSASAEGDPAVAFDGTNYLLVWRDTRSYAARLTGIVGARVAPDGAVLDPAGIAIADDATAESRPAVAFAAGNYLVLWEDRRAPTAPDVFATRVGTDGAVLDPGGFPVHQAPGAQGRPAVAGGEGGFFAVWEDGAGIAGARLGADGRPLDAPVLALATQGAACPNGCAEPAVAAGAGGWLATWSSALAVSGASAEVRGARVGAAGDPAPVGIALGAGLRSSPTVAFDGSGFLVAWTEAGGAEVDVRAARVAGDGSVLDPAGLDVATGPGRRADVRAAFDGSRHLLVWRDALAGDLAGAEVTPRGGVAETFAVSAEPGEERHPALACDGRGGCLVAYERDLAAAGSSRVLARRVTGLAPGIRCAAGAECSTGFCVDGVCCDTPCGGGDPSDCQACSTAAGAPADGTCAPVVAGTVCRAAAGACDAAGVCDGSALACPPDAPRADGSPCDDGDRCTSGDACQGGACAPGAPVVCASPGPCLAAACDPATGACRSSPVPDGASCSDGDRCTVGDACRGGACVPGVPLVCPQVACRTSTCNPGTGTCSDAPLPDGTPCDGGSRCTSGDRCVAGSCVSGPPVTCPQPVNRCMAAACDPAAGCVAHPVADGTPCDDEDACTTGDACAAGACVAAAEVTCAPADACHAAGACDPATGACSSPPAPDGTPCDDANPCTELDACASGTCAGVPRTCPAADACHIAGACDPVTGACSSPPAPDGTPCDDGNACTRSDACAAGTCTGGAPVVCPPPAACHLAGACEPATGACSSPPAPDGTPCAGGTCAGGVCRPGQESGGGCGYGTGSPANLASVALLALALLPRRLRRSPAGRA